MYEIEPHISSSTPRISPFYVDEGWTNRRLMCWDGREREGVRLQVSSDRWIVGSQESVVARSQMQRDRPSRDMGSGWRSAVWKLEALPQRVNAHQEATKPKQLPRRPFIFVIVSNFFILSHFLAFKVASFSQQLAFMCMLSHHRNVQSRARRFGGLSDTLSESITERRFEELFLVEHECCLRPQATP